MANYYHLFPYVEDKDKLKKLKIDEESSHYITKRHDATYISNILVEHIEKYKSCKKVRLCDMTAGVGGNVLSFAKYFKKIIAFEINKKWFDYLNNNINVFEFKNIKSVNKDCLKIIKRVKKIDIFFVDPPWGGVNYKNIDNIKIKLNNISINSLIKIILKKNPKIIAFKLPKNYEYMKIVKKYENHKKINNIFIHKIHNMNIVILTLIKKIII